MYVDYTGAITSPCMLFNCEYTEGGYGESIDPNKVIRFDFAANPEFGISNSGEYVYEMQTNGLPKNRTHDGIWFELISHYVVYKIDVFDIIDNDNIADIGNYGNDKNAIVWEYAVFLVKYGKAKWREVLDYEA